MTIQTKFTVALGADHGGWKLKDSLADWLRKAGHEVRDFGTNGAESVDYPDYAHVVSQSVLSGESRFGILVCGTGLGMSYAANRHPGIRCAMVNEPTSARLARQHNDANMLSLGGRMIGEEAAFDILATFLATEFEGGRHERRVAKIETGA
jgi:ribose 5-phosphate isomerase B